MKIDRLLGIITILLQRNKVTAPELAKKFEVSRRTIHRDIDDICKAGIPIITYQGGDGGISIADGYKLDKSVLSVDELQSIITGLKNLGSISDTARIERLISKLSPKTEAVISIKDNILIDLSSHYKSSLSEKISLIKSAISDENRITILIDKSLEYRLVEEYGSNCYEVMEDGSLKFSAGYTNRDYMVSWVLGFGDKATVVEPIDLANEIKEKAKNIIRNYEHDI